MDTYGEVVLSESGHIIPDDSTPVPCWELLDPTVYNTSTTFDNSTTCFSTYLSSEVDLSVAQRLPLTICHVCPKTGLPFSHSPPHSHGSPSRLSVTPRISRPKVSAICSTESLLEPLRPSSLRRRPRAKLPVPVRPRSVSSASQRRFSRRATVEGRPGRHV